MTFWRPAEQWRGAHGYWWNSDILKRVELQGYAAKLFFNHFNVLPQWVEAENDRDHLPW